MNELDLVELRYLSEAKADMNIWSLTAIVDVATTLNNLNSVTGILFFESGYFGQILEGSKSAVEETWIRIQADSRHHNIELLGITEIKERRFPKWSLKLFNTQEFSVTFPQFADLIAKIDNPDEKTFQVLRRLWREA